MWCGSSPKKNAHFKGSKNIFSDVSTFSLSGIKQKKICGALICFFFLTKNELNLSLFSLSRSLARCRPPFQRIICFKVADLVTKAEASSVEVPSCVEDYDNELLKIPLIRLRVNVVFFNLVLIICAYWFPINKKWCFSGGLHWVWTYQCSTVWTAICWQSCQSQWYHFMPKKESR